MADHLEPWNPILAIKPFLLTLSLLSISLFHLSFPTTLNRFFVLTIVSLLAGTAFLNSQELFPDSYAEEIFLRFVIIWLAHFSSLCLKEVKMEKGVASLHATLRQPPKNPWKRGYKLLFNGRGIGTTWELSYLHRSSTQPFDLRHPTQKPLPQRPIPSSNIPRRILSILAHYAILCIYYTYLDLALHLPLRPTDTLPSKESLIRRTFFPNLLSTPTSPPTSRDLLVRLWTVLDLILPDYLILTIYHNIFATLFIASGLDTDNEWPPLFGRIRDAWSVRVVWVGGRETENTGDKDAGEYTGVCNVGGYAWGCELEVGECVCLG
ncbi:hypothetical protein T440DRAFT_505047 [Plenodomus tracheiphilus IPT5]|uniref:Wax synthase domain-containing protein n=1 Tax=Plenodomus tracheiphilus IPT5 TaxID=1408161 RepID=A0A6A7BK87_9PLEO|nr:hypothetical protein T440DRAFT_505047 [Plenodomus tracheiphilus IPT5]